MKKYKIYTAGKMNGLSFEEQMLWRVMLHKAILSHEDVNVKVIHPPLYYNYEAKDNQSEREILEWELFQLYDSDVMVVNLDEIDSTIGTHIEIGMAHTINNFTDKHIFIIGFGGDVENLHPWIKEACIRIEKNVEDVANYLYEYILL